MSGYRVDVTAMSQAASRLVDAADEVGTAAARLDDSAGDLGPGEITAEVDALTALWVDRLHTARDDMRAAADGVRTAAESYLRADEQVADDLRRARPW